MHRVIELTDEEKRTAYLKLSKEQLIEMLIQNQKTIQRLKPERPKFEIYHGEFFAI